MGVITGRKDTTAFAALALQLFGSSSSSLNVLVSGEQQFLPASRPILSEEHNEIVLKDLLGMDDESYEYLQAQRLSKSALVQDDEGEDQGQAAPASIGFLLHGVNGVAASRQPEAEKLMAVLGNDGKTNYQFYPLEYIDTDKYTTELDQKLATFIEPLIDQALRACENIKALVTEKLPLGKKKWDNIAIIGHSNGGVISRAVVSNCTLPGDNVWTHFVSDDGPLRGIQDPYNIKRTANMTAASNLKDRMTDEQKQMAAENEAAYLPGPVGYMYKPQSLEQWHSSNSFMAILDNTAECTKSENLVNGKPQCYSVKSPGKDQTQAWYSDFWQAREQQKHNMTQLKAGAFLLRSTNPMIIDPEESAWLGESKKKSLLPGSAVTVPFEKTGAFYDQDTAGFRTLHEEGKVFMYRSLNGHTKLDDADYSVIMKYLANDTSFASKWNTRDAPTKKAGDTFGKFHYSDYMPKY